MCDGRRLAGRGERRSRVRNIRRRGVDGAFIIVCSSPAHAKSSYVVARAWGWRQRRRNSSDQRRFDCACLSDALVCVRVKCFVRPRSNATDEWGWTERVLGGREEEK